VVSHPAVVLETKVDTNMEDEIPGVITNDRSKVCEIVSRMLDEPRDGGIYRTTRAYNELEALLRTARAEAVGFAFGAACQCLDRGIDPRKVEMPEVLERANAALNPNWVPPSEDSPS
jgi:hypothetical protein